MTVHAKYRGRILRAMQEANAGIVFDNARRLTRHFRSVGLYPKVQAAFVRDLFASLGPLRWTEVADAMFDEPYEYRKGWPDLTVIDAGRPRFVEVKARDRLHASQIITICRMKPVLGDVFEVMQIKH
jgi:hypothetical protein